MQNGVLIHGVCLNDVSVEMLSVSYVFNICRNFFFFRSYEWRTELGGCDGGYTMYYRFDDAHIG